MTHTGPRIERIFSSPPLLIAFQGHALKHVMRKHRISNGDLNGCLRAKAVWSIKDVEAVIIEANGLFSIYLIEDKPRGTELDVLMNVPAYRNLIERQRSDQEKQITGGSQEQRETSENDIAADAA
jgi:uncharacterized membrane protein YcaP (DUF421 family)